jgi:hypothetical protein
MKPTPRSLPARLGAALPDAVSALFFLSVWVAPLAFGAGMVKTAMLIMLVEFILVHASAFLGNIAFSETASRATKLRGLLLFTGFYLLFVLAFCFAFSAWWPVLAFGWLLAAKLVVAMDRRVPAPELLLRMQSAWALSAMAYLGGVFLTVMMPLPRLDMTRAIQPEFGLPGSGHWIDHPHTVVAFGAIYFGFLAWAKWKDWVLPASGFKGSAPKA